MTTADVFNCLARPIVFKALDGINGTIFTYGNTSSGKTYTMVGNQAAPGIIPLAAKEIFHSIKNSKQRAFLVRIGYIEIYNDKIFDLFDNRRSGLSIFESNGETITDQKDFVVKSEKEVLTYFKIGNNCKKTSQTANNDNSSRSHTIFRISIESQNANSDVPDHKVSNLYLIDLAGSEKPDSSKPTFYESLHINKSLLALGKIIRELGKKKTSMKSANFRECKITRVLSPALKGNSLTTVICCVSKVDEETYQTISFSQSLKKIKTYPVMNFARKILQNLKPETTPSLKTDQKTTSDHQFLNLSSSQRGNLNDKVNQLEKEKMKAQENLTNSSVQIEMKQKIIDVLHGKLSESLEHQQASDQIYQNMILEREKTIESLETKVSENEKLYDSHLEAKQDAFQILEETYNDENESLRKDVELYKKAMVEKELFIKKMETKIHSLEEEKSEVKRNYDKRFKEIKRHYGMQLKVKDEKIYELNNVREDLVRSADEKEIEVLEMYLKLEKHYGKKLCDALKNIDQLKNLLKDKTQRIDGYEDEISFLQFQLHSIEQKGIDHANLQKQQFEMIIKENSKSFKEFEHQKKTEILNLKVLIEEKEGRIARHKQALKDMTEKEIKQANILKEKFESKIMVIDNNFTELLREKDEEILEIMEKLSIENENRPSSSCSKEIEALKTLLASTEFHKCAEISSEIRKFFKVLENLIFISSQSNDIPLSPTSSIESGIEKSPIIKGSLCNFCDRSFVRKFSLERHVRYKHFSKLNVL